MVPALGNEESTQERKGKSVLHTLQQAPRTCEKAVQAEEAYEVRGRANAREIVRIKQGWTANHWDISLRTAHDILRIN